MYFFMFCYSRSDSAYFDGLDETILCVGLVKAKPGKACYYIYNLLLGSVGLHVNEYIYVCSVSAGALKHLWLKTEPRVTAVF